MEFSEKKIKERQVIINGYSNEKQNLGKHLRSATSAYLDVLVLSNCLSHASVTRIKSFNKSNGSLKDFQELMGDDDIREHCLEHY